MNHEIPQRHMANRRMLAIAAVLIMMLSVVPLSIILSDSDTEADTDGRVQVTYNVGEVSIEDGYNYGFSKSSYTFTYYGTAVAEYNPQFWSDYTVGVVGVGEKVSNWLEIKQYAQRLYSPDGSAMGRLSIRGRTSQVNSEALIVLR